MSALTLCEYDILRGIEDPPPGWEMEEGDIGLPFFRYPNLSGGYDAQVSHVFRTNRWKWIIRESSTSCTISEGDVEGLLPAMAEAKKRLQISEKTCPRIP